MKILCTFPGRHGDLLWALPTLRALSRRIGEPVSLQIAGEFASLLPLLQMQPYLESVHVDHTWAMGATQAENRPTTPDGYWDLILHLGYTDWPARGLPYHTLDQLNLQLETIKWERGLPSGPLGVQDSLLVFGDDELDLGTPWITAPHIGIGPWSYCWGFTDAHFEVKYGIIRLLEDQRPRVWPPPLCIGANPRWQTEGGHGPTSWLQSAAVLQRSGFFFGCCSALHVLAVGLGTPVVLMEPMEARWNPIFYPLGMDGPQVRVVKGSDGKPTFDARAVAAAITAALPPVHQSAISCGCDYGLTPPHICERHLEERR